MSDIKWHKSSFSEPNGEDCIEVAETAVVTHVRDTKDRTIPGLTVGNGAWTALVEYAKRQKV